MIIFLNVRTNHGTVLEGHICHFVLGTDSQEFDTLIDIAQKLIKRKDYYLQLYFLNNK